MIQRREHNGAASVFPASLVCDGWCVGIWSWGQRCVTRGVVRVSKGRDGGFLCIGTLSIGIVRRGASCVVFPRRGTRVARGVGKREKGKPSAREEAVTLRRASGSGSVRRSPFRSWGMKKSTLRERSSLIRSFHRSLAQRSSRAHPRHGTRLVEDEDADRMQRRCAPAAGQQQHQPRRPNQPPTPLQSHSRRRHETTRALSRSRTRSPALETV